MLVAKELEEARLLGHQSRETSWTDRMLFELKRLRDPQVVAVTSNERVTGADMDWWFVRRQSNVNFHLTIQAKILHYKQASPKLWHYEDLAHPVKAPGLQSRTLVRHARQMLRAETPVYPFYIFHNPEAVRPSAQFQWLPSGNGVTVLDGFVVASHIAHHIQTRALPIAAKRHVVLSPMMESLHYLLCSGLNDVPDPEVVKDRVEEHYRRIGRELELPYMVRRVKPALGKQLPSSIRSIVSRSGGDDRVRDDLPDDEVPRDTIVFISG